MFLICIFILAISATNSLAEFDAPKAEECARKVYDNEDWGFADIARQCLDFPDENVKCLIENFKEGETDSGDLSVRCSPGLPDRLKENYNGLRDLQRELDEFQKRFDAAVSSLTPEQMALIEDEEKGEKMFAELDAGEDQDATAKKLSEEYGIPEVIFEAYYKIESMTKRMEHLNSENTEILNTIDGPERDAVNKMQFLTNHANKPVE